MLVVSLGTPGLTPSQAPPPATAFLHEDHRPPVGQSAAAFTAQATLLRQIAFLGCEPRAQRQHFLIKCALSQTALLRCEPGAQMRRFLVKCARGKTAGSCRIRPGQQANHSQFVRMQMTFRVCCIWPCTMSDVHASCCDCASIAQNLYPFKHLSTETKLALYKKYRGSNSMPNTEVIMHEVSRQMPAESH